MNKKDQYNLISVSSLFYPATGGLETMLYNLLNHLAKKGYKMIQIHGRADENKTYTLNGYTVKAFKTRNLFNNTYPVFSLKFLLYIHKIIRSNKNATVLLHSRHFLSSFLTAFACSLLKKEYFLVEHTAQTSFLKNQLAQKLVNFYEKTFSKFVLKKAKLIISASNASKNYLIEEHAVPKDKIIVIHNGFNKKELEKYMDLSEKKEKIVLFATKMIKVKNPIVTYKVFVDFAKKYKEWKFYFIGTGDFFKATKTEDKNLRIINKMLPREEILKLYAKSSIYVNSSLSEGLSLAIIEASFLKNTPVLSDAPSNIEISKRIGTDDLIFRKDSIEDLKEKIDIAIGRVEDTRFISHIQQKTDNHFNNNKLFQEYEDSLFSNL